ncbi:MAG: hypothetical protein ACI31M_01865 [Bacilli bacterium]
MEKISEKDIMYKKRMISGSEASTFKTDLGVYKKFNNSVSEEMRLIKIQQLYYLNTLNLIKDYFAELKYIVEDEKILGYIMEPILGFGLDSRNYDFESKVYLLNVIANKLVTLRESDILIFDIRNPNIIIEKIEQHNSFIYNPRFLDADSVTIKGFPENKIPVSLNKYLKHGGKKDENAETFMFNLFSAGVLNAHKTEYDKTGRRIIKQLTLNKVDCDADNELLINHIINHQK